MEKEECVNFSNPWGYPFRQTLTRPTAYTFVRWTFRGCLDYTCRIQLRNIILVLLKKVIPTRLLFLAQLGDVSLAVDCNTKKLLNGGILHEMHTLLFYTLYTRTQLA